MNFIIFDLEWNNAYSYAKKGFMNEIIEIGAVKLNNKLETVDTFKQLVMPKLTKKLSGRCKNLTNITNEELKENGVPFSQAIKEFARWSKGENNLFMTWSNSDLYVLTSNYQAFLGNLNIDFITKYCDAQKYCMSFIERDNKNQISLSDCAQEFGIDIDVEKLHRALTDCYLTAECLKKIYDREKLAGFVNDCDNRFFEKLIYKPYLITKPVTDVFNIYEQELVCPVCKGVLHRVDEFDCVNKSFRCPTKCKKCRKTFWTTVRAKKTYDKVEVYQRSIEMNRKKAKRIKKD